MLRDRYGLEISTASETARDAYVDGVDRMLAADGGVEERLAAAVEADPDFALPHIALARQHQVMARGSEARDAADRAKELVADRGTGRETRHVEILAGVVGGDAAGSLALTREHVQEFPRDAFALAPACGVFGTIGFSGRVDREREQLALLEPLAASYGDDWWFLTVHAFALVETGQWDRGRELARRAVELRPTNAHAVHTLTHALYEGGRDDEALEFLGGWLPDSDRSGLLHCHNWWHYAILLMTAGRLDEASEAFSGNCLPGATDSPSINVFTDSASYLWRAELAGHGRNLDHWEQVRSFYEDSFRRPIVFVDAHAGLAYAALGRTEELTACIDQLLTLGEGGKLPAGTVAHALNQAWAATVDQRWSDVIQLLEGTRSELPRIGGSRAQSDLVTNTLLAAYVNDDRLDDARRLVDGEVDRQPTHAVAGLS